MVDKKKLYCFICGGEITETEIEFEDYYRISRGHTPNAELRFICFNCVQSSLNKVRKCSEVFNGVAF